ncbi:MAG TPA: hypothetical protein VFV99_18890 [Kofleriaceae bacterium]|nr:hypothetical protein [Kofleriaceae bacterium]
MNTLFWLSFFFSSPPHNTCAVSGTPLLEIRERSETSSAITTKRIYSTGAWTFASDDATAQGCFSTKGLREIRSALQHAAWKVTQSPIACFAYDPNYTEYVLNGRLRFTYRMCSGKTADSETMAAIDLVNRDLAAAMPPPPPPPPPPVQRPPVSACRATGVPLFEIDKRSDAAVPTSTTKIYNTGAWTYLPVDKDGHAGAQQTGCFAKPTLQAIRHAITDAPWTITYSRIVCRAYSANYTVYSVGDKVEYTARLCGAQRLDDESTAAIKLIETELAAVLPRQAAR